MRPVFGLTVFSDGGADDADGRLEVGLDFEVVESHGNDELLKISAICLTRMFVKLIVMAFEGLVAQW